ncbi:MAG: GAF domain-containing protein, partial [Deltaproteobacteria bacterium]|nr:GAF domain-containing protein [Deltaproteobacteria bacterium]
MAKKEPKSNFSKSEGGPKKYDSIGMDRSKTRKKIDLFSIGVLNSLSAHIAVLDIDGNIIAVNDAWKKFAEQNDRDGGSVGIGSNYFNVCMQAINDEDDQDALHALKGIQKVISSEIGEFEYEYACHSPDEKRWFLMRVTQMRFMGDKAVVSHINITDKKIAEMDLIEREKELSALNFIGRTVSSSISLEAVINAALDQITAIIKPDLAMIFLREGNDLILKGLGPKSQANKYKIHDNHRVGQCLCGLSVSNEKSIFSENIKTDSRCTWKECKVAGFTSFAAIPLICREEVIGTLGMGSVAKRNFEKRRQFLEAIVNDVSICLDNSLLYEKVKTYAEDLKKQISDRKDMEKVLIQTQKMESIGTLAGGIAHDFNNILFPIIGYTEMILEDISTESPFRESLGEILKGALRAKDLVKQILMFSRQTRQEMRPLKVQNILTEVLKLSRSTLPTTIRIKQNINKECGLVMADQTQVHQIAMNLITNAFHAMEKSEGTLTVSLREVDLTHDSLPEPNLIPGPYICLTIADTGVGMEIETQKRIFEPYFTTKEKDKGTGLGLAVVHGIVIACGGAIVVESELGKGTEIKVYFPRIVSEVETKTKVQPTPLPSGNERILLVDDEEPISVMVKAMLERLGYQVTVHNSSTDTLEAFKAAPRSYDLIISDMTMPN